jgi:hypothetical protein
MFEAGAVFRYRLGDSLGHIYFVLSDPAKYPNEVIIVNLTSVQPPRRMDRTCLVREGEHPEVRHESFAFYQRIRISNLANLQRQERTGIIQLLESCHPDLLERLRLGIPQSRRTPLDVAAAFRRQFPR